MEFQTNQLPVIVDATKAGNDFGWILMVGVLGLVGTECLLAMRFGHYRRT
jgi:hypothetical protein